MGQADLPAISVILATYDAGLQVRAAVDSILAQTTPNFELIVVDDCSDDATLSIVRGYTDPRVRLFVTPERLGLAGARRQAVGVARGRYVAAMSQEDVSRPDRLAAQMAFLDAHPDVVLLGAAAATLRDNKEIPDRYPARTTPALLRWLLHIVNPLVWSSVMMRASALRGLVHFAREDYALAEDYDLYHRLAALGEVARLDDKFVTRRWREQGVSRVTELRMNASATKVLADAYLPWFGPASHAYAELMVVHVAAGRPVPDISTLNRVGAILQSVARSFAGTYKPDETTRQMIAAEISRLWWASARTAIRAGTVSQTLVLENRPDFAAPDGLTAKDLFRSGLIGGIRARRRS